MPNIKYNSQVTLALITIFGFFFCIFYMLKWEFPIANKDALNALMGVLTTIFTLQMNFFFGSSTGSKSKDDAINDIAKNMPSSGSTVSAPNASSVKVETSGGDVNVAAAPVKNPLDSLHKTEEGD